MSEIQPLQSISPDRFESTAILKKLAGTSRKLAELKGVAASIPNQNILINTLSIQEAKDSSAIENIVTTHDDLYRGETLPESAGNAAAKEVLRYREALRIGHAQVQSSGLLTINTMVAIQAALEQNSAGLRKLPGTTLQDGTGRVVYTPPQDQATIVSAMGDLERFMNDDSVFDADPLIKMALIHHQFESIHPFYDGNGRTGRIVNVLYLVKECLLDNPVLYLSRHIVRTKAEYYRLLQDAREKDAWEDWVLYILRAVESTAGDTIETIARIRTALMEYKHGIREKHRFYSQDLINNLFSHPYTRIEFVVRDLHVSRLTATKYLDELSASGFLRKERSGRANFYINIALVEILTGIETGGE
ncbi:MAG: Fic family protein [Ignavibacteria bacterium]|nr:Fic family protein [Ignavibacteria bacterium]